MALNKTPTSSKKAQNAPKTALKAKQKLIKSMAEKKVRKTTYIEPTEKIDPSNDHESEETEVK